MDRTFNTRNVDIVMGISIIRDQSTSKVIACKLNGIRVDVADGSTNASSIDLNDGFSWRDCSGCKLRIDVRGSLYVASNF